MNEVSIIINGVRYDAVADTYSNCTSKECDLYDNVSGCRHCIIGIDTCERLIDIDYVFKKSTKSFEP